jgi:hypothetical protein
MTHSFGEGYSTRSDEEGFGGVYGGNDPVEHPGTEIHPSHPGTFARATSGFLMPFFRCGLTGWL